LKEKINFSFIQFKYQKGSINLEPFSFYMKPINYILFFFFSFCAKAQHIDTGVSIDLFKKIIYTLADDSMRGRASGSPEERMALTYISKTFKQFSNKTLKYQKFDFELDSVNYSCQNAYFFLNNHCKKTIVISAHYDHIGLGGHLSMSMKSNEIHNGADDNASGVAMLLALSKNLTEFKGKEVNYLFVFYSGHELGLYGSAQFAQFVEKKKNKFKSIAAIVNFDMLGRFDNSTRMLKCMRSESLDSLLISLPAAKHGIELKIADASRLKSLDTKAFDAKGIPCLNFSTGSHDDYHKTSDDAKFINYHGLMKIHSFILELLLELDLETKKSN
jgi:aminopeptidase-like protein